MAAPAAGQAVLSQEAEMAKVKLSLAAAALAAFVLYQHDRKTGREEGDPVDLKPGKSVEVETSDDFQIYVTGNGGANPKADGTRSVFTAETPKGNDQVVKIAVTDTTGTNDTFLLGAGEKKTFAIGDDQRLTIDPGDKIE